MARYKTHQEQTEFIVLEESHYGYSHLSFLCLNWISVWRCFTVSPLTLVLWKWYPILTPHRRAIAPWCSTCFVHEEDPRFSSSHLQVGRTGKHLSETQVCCCQSGKTVHELMVWHSKTKLYILTLPLWNPPPWNTPLYCTHYTELLWKGPERATCTLQWGYLQNLLLCTPLAMPLIRITLFFFAQAKFCISIYFLIWFLFYCSLLISIVWNFMPCCAVIRFMVGILSFILMVLWVTQTACQFHKQTRKRGRKTYKTKMFIEKKHKIDSYLHATVRNLRHWDGWLIALEGNTNYIRHAGNLVGKWGSIAICKLGGKIAPVAGMRSSSSTGKEWDASKLSIGSTCCQSHWLIRRQVTHTNTHTQVFPSLHQPMDAL